MANWSDLSLDLLVSVANRIDQVEDFITFGLVCKPWRLAAAKENFTGGLTHQVPWLLLYPTENNAENFAWLRKNIANNSDAEYYNMRTDMTHKLNLGECKRYEVCSSSLGWLIIVSEDFKVSLLHPLNHHPIVKLPKFPRSCSMDKFALSSSPSSTSDYVVMAIYGGGSKLAFCRPGDDRWIRVAGGKPVHWYSDVTYYKGQFHIVVSSGCVLVCDIQDNGKAKTRVIIDQWVPLGHGSRDVKYYLVESRGVLLAVQRAWRDVIVGNQLRQKIQFRVFEVPFSNGNWLDTEVTNLGCRTLFLDRRCLFAIEVSTYSSCEKNCIYYIGQSLFRYATEVGGILFTMDMADNITKTNLGKYSGQQIPDIWIQPSL